MDFKDISKANDLAEQLIKLKAWLKNSWKTDDNECRLLFAYKPSQIDDSRSASVDIPMMYAREAVNGEISRLTTELTKMGVLVKLPD